MKSNVRNHLELVENILLDASTWCSAEVSIKPDLKTIRSRVENEGISFLTITLPQFCRDFESALQAGRIDSTLFRSFRKRGAIPAFLQGMTSQIFDIETGELQDEVTPAFVEAVRQVCLSFKKLEIGCSPSREAAALDNFVRVEQDLETFSLPQVLRSSFLAVSECLWHNCLAVISLDDAVPRHGPGATAERVSGNQKYVWQEWYERLEPYFPFLGCAYSANLDQEDSEFKKITLVPVEFERPVRVVLVPKTLKAPRVIAIEPACMQYAQQAIRDLLYRSIESYWLTKGQVNFTDQSINQSLALTSSIDGQLATIDLSDASDRVPCDLAMEMFNSNPDLKDAIAACRSTSALLPDGRLVSPLRKFASMGSALCFPIEAMYFYTICVVALLEKYKLPPAPSNVHNVTRRVFVYGDDIIVPAGDADAVLGHLQKYHCKVNSSKTFVTGKFRESCGVDAYDGVLVTPVYIRQVCPQNRQQVQSLISWVSTANQFYKKGYWRTASFMFAQCERYLGQLPYVSEESPVLGRVSFLGYRSVLGWNDLFQAPSVRGWIPSPVYRSDSVDGYSALQKSLLRLKRATPEQDVEARTRFANNIVKVLAEDPYHLERTAQYGAVTLKRRWAQV